jgi:AcrR family transcriptional regulator
VPRNATSDKSPATRTKRRPRLSAEARRAEILKAARTEFVRLGYAGATFQKIAQTADVNEAMLFRLFGTKEQLYEEAVAAPLEEAVNHAFTPVTGDADLRAVSERFVEELLGGMEDIAPMLVAVLSDETRGRAFYRKRFEPAIDRLVEQIQSNLPLWDHEEFDPHLALRSMIGMCLFIAVDERFGTRRQGDSETVASQLISFMWDGLRSRHE